MEEIVMMSGVTSKGKPFVTYQWEKLAAQWSPDEARKHALGLLAVAEAAEHDAITFQFLRDKTGLEIDAAGLMIADLRNYRRSED
jgi:hypothetical protein